MTEQSGPSAAVYKLDASHTDAAVAVLARAFSHAPMWTWALPDEQHRKRDSDQHDSGVYTAPRRSQSNRSIALFNATRPPVSPASESVLPSSLV